MGTLESVVVGILSSVAASVLWILMLSRLTPKLSISPVIAEDPETDPETPVFRIKVVNRSRRAAMDLRFQVDLMTFRVKGGNVNRRVPLKCGNAPLMFPRYDRSDKDHGNAYRLRINSDIRKLLREQPNASIRLQIFARHELSGMGKVFEQRYFHPNSEIVTGTFVRGQDLALIPEQP
jgi:hypothetical protein